MSSGWKFARELWGAISAPTDRLGLVLLPAAFVALVVWSWRKWPDVLVDFGRELYIPWQMANGQVLYADIAYFNGPLSPWINSVVFQVFGVSLLTLVTANLLVLVIVAGMIYFLVRQVSRPFTATVATLVFLTVFSVGQYMPQGNYNFVTPYSHEMTHGMLFSLAALVILSLYLRRGNVGSIFACGLALGLTFLTKAEFFVAIVFAVLGGLAAHHWQARTPLRKLVLIAASLVAGTILPVVVAFLALARHLPSGEAIRGVLGSWAYLFIGELSESELYKNILGVGDTGESLRSIGVGSLRYAAFLVPAALIGWWLPRSGRAWRIATVLLFPLGIIGLLTNLETATQVALAQPVPLAMLGVVGVLLLMQTRPAGSAGDRARNVLMLASALFGMALLAKILLYVRFSHYGFALAMPAAIVLTVALVDGIPVVLDSREKNGAAFRNAVLGVLVGLMMVHLYASNSWFRLRTVEVGAGSDAFLTDARGRVAADVLARLELMTTPGQTLAVFPEGVMLNYLSRITNPTPHINFMPPELIMFGEETIVAAFESNPPDWIVLTDRHVPEYGYDLLGTDYGLKIAQWIERDYRLAAEVVDEAANREQLRYAYILRRRDAVDP